MVDIYRSTSPHLGYRQQSKNCVLVKDDVGKARPTCRSLPEHRHAFGWCEPGDPLGVAELMNWFPHEPSARRKSEGQDFQRLNKAALKSRVSSPKQMAKFLRNQSVPTPLRPITPPRAQPSMIPSDVIPGSPMGEKADLLLQSPQWLGMTMVQTWIR